LIALLWRSGRVFTPGKISQNLGDLIAMLITSNRKHTEKRFQRTKLHHISPRYCLPHNASAA
jgi:hypothetical protein